MGPADSLRRMAKRPAAKRIGSEERRRTILDAARELFAAKGYKATTTASIAETVGVTEPILYRHFKGKREIFIAILEEATEAAMTYWRELCEDAPDPVSKIAVVLKSFPELVRRQGEIQRLVHRAMVAETSDEQVLAIVRSYFLEYEGFLAAIIQDGQGDGSLRTDMDPTIAAWQILSVGMMYHLTRPLELPSRQKRGYGTATIEHLLRTLRP